MGGANGAEPRLWRLFSAAPVLPGGWALVGEEAKYVRVSPQRLLVAAPAAPAAGASDALNASELAAGGGGGLSVCVLGAPGEVVRVTLLAPLVRADAGTTVATTDTGARASSAVAAAAAAAAVPSAAEAIAAGRILLVDVAVPAGGGSACVQCRTGGGPISPSCASAAARGPAP